MSRHLKSVVYGLEAMSSLEMVPATGRPPAHLPDGGAGPSIFAPKRAGNAPRS